MLKWLQEHFPPPYRFLSVLGFIVLADVLDVYERFVTHLSKLLDYWEIKVVAGSFLSLIMSIHETDVAYIAQAIFWLIVIDIITKWFAISYEYLQEEGVPKERITVISAFYGWVPAFRAGKINSSHLGFGFVSKVVQIALLLVAGDMIDSALANSHIELGIRAITFTIGYVCYSESLSIIENMRDSGVPHMDKLMDLMSTNVLGRLRK